jgi:hypothetical protein
MRVGYARVSTEDQTLDLQRDALKRAKCRDIYEEHASGKNTARPQLEACLKALRDGDTLIVWRLDRLGRSLGDLIRLTHELKARGVGFASLTEQIDTRSPGSGASRDFGPAKTSWRIEDPQAAKQKCLISSRFPSLTRVPLSASAAERRLLSADAPEPLKLPRNPTGSYCSKIKSTPMRAIWLAFNGDHCAVPLSNVGASKSLDRGRYTFEPAQCHRRKSAPDVGEQSARRSSPSS